MVIFTERVNTTSIGLIKNKWNSAIKIAFEVEGLFARLINIGKTVPFHKKNLFVVRGNILRMIAVIQRNI
jgi:hypothetical protein